MCTGGLHWPAAIKHLKILNMFSFIFLHGDSLYTTRNVLENKIFQRNRIEAIINVCQKFLSFCSCIYTIINTLATIWGKMTCNFLWSKPKLFVVQYLVHIWHMFKPQSIKKSLQIFNCRGSWPGQACAGNVETPFTAIASTISYVYRVSPQSFLGYSFIPVLTVPDKKQLVESEYLCRMLDQIYTDDTCTMQLRNSRASVAST